MIFNIEPISINKAFQGRRFHTPAYKQFEKDFSTLIQYQKLKPVKGDVSIEIIFHFKNSLSDIDNCLKPIFDILVKNKIIDDDRFIKVLKVIKIVGKQTYFNIDIEKI